MLCILSGQYSVKEITLQQTFYFIQKLLYDTLEINALPYKIIQNIFIYLYKKNWNLFP
jgi:hypothetical protein